MGSNKCASCGQWSGRGHRCPSPAPAAAEHPTLTVPSPAATNPYADDVQARTAAAAAALTARSSVTPADVEQRMWEREQAERMGLDPDAHAGPVLFTDEEWEAMTSTREARIAFGYELPCGCRPGSCPSQYGGDCNYAPTEEDYIDEDSGPSGGAYANRQDIDDHVALLGKNFQRLQESLALRGIEESVRASRGLTTIRKQYPLDMPAGPERVVEQLDNFVRGIDMILDDPQTSPTVNWDAVVARATATKIAYRIKETFPDRFPAHHHPESAQFIPDDYAEPPF